MTWNMRKGWRWWNILLTLQCTDPHTRRRWHTILTNQDGEYWSQLTPGNALIFDNHRVLHGRAAFVGNRRLCGAYVNHDDYRSRLAVLRTQFVKNGERTGAGTATRERSVWDEAI